MKQTITVILADDHRLFLDSLHFMLQGAEEFSFDVIGEANNGDELIRLVKTCQPDLLLLDLNMPEKDGLRVLSEIRAMLVNTRILVLTMYDDIKIVKSVLKSGADGYLLKNSGKKELFAAIRTIFEGKTYLSEGISLTEPTLPKGDEYEDRFMKKYNLTKREIEVLKLITRAMSNKQIAKELYISDQTVSVHRKNIMRKLGVSNAAGLMKIAYDSSLI